MKFQFPRLVVFITLLSAGLAQAATLNFNGGAVSGCSYSNQTYNCATLPLANNNDSTIIASGYTVIVASDVSFGSNQGLQMSGSAKLQTSGASNLDISGIGTSLVNVTGGTLTTGGNFRFGSSAQSITANVIAATVTTSGASTSITGSVTATGLIDLGSSSTITGPVTAGSIKTNANVNLGSTLTVTGSVDLGSNNSIAGAVSAASVTTNSNVNFGGGISATGTVDLASGVTISGGISGSTITTNSNVTITGAVTATNSFELGSGGSLTGNVTAPTVTLDASNVQVKGNITASSSVTIASGNTVTGNVSGGALTMNSANAVINGNVNMSGDVSMGSSATINGDLTARNVTTHASGDYISGNATVNSIYLDNGATIGKTIMCMAGGGATCSCVTKADPNYHPTCSSPTTVADHIQITHSGTALTCQPQTVSLTACANSSCTPPHFSGSTTATLQPGGQQFTFTGTGTGTVQQSSKGTATLSATSAGIGAASTCLNTATNTASCAMAFDDTGLTLTVPDHYSAMTPTVTIAALQKIGNNPSCVPLLANVNATVNFNCSYNNPASGTAQLTINGSGGSKAFSCTGADNGVSVSFNNSGVATPTLSYPDAGRISLGANYTAGSGATALYAKGATSFVAAPKSFQVQAISQAVGYTPPATVFARGSDPFTLKITALNSIGGTTANFGKESGTAEDIKITESLIYPSGGYNASTLLTQGQFSAIASGIKSSASGTAGYWQFDEVGTIRLTAALLNASGNYLGATGLAPTGSVDLRLVPHHFDTALAGTVPMSCADVGGGVNPCAPLNTSGKFVYSGQPFGMTATAYIGKQSGSTYVKATNYVDGGTVPVAQAITLTAWSAPGSAGSQLPPATGSMGWSPNSTIKFIFAAVPSGVAGTGIGTVDSNGNQPYFAFSALTAPTTIYLRAIDNDGVSSQTGVEAPLTVVSGQLQVTNNYGSENIAMPVTVNAQYWTGSGYAFNSQYAFTAIINDSTAPSPGIIYSNCQKNLSNGGNCVPLLLANGGALTLVNGTGRFQIKAPGKSGAVDVQLMPQNFVNFGISYLPSSKGRETFGVYRSGPVVYTREVY